MVFYCSAYNCKNNTRDKSLAFHSFPLKNPDLLKKWLRNMKWKDWTPEPHSKICSSHFERKCYNIVGGTRRRLHTWAVPTIFSFPGHLQSRKRKIDPRSRRAMGIIEAALDLPPAKLSHTSSTVITIEPEPVTGFTVLQSHQSEELGSQNPTEPCIQDTAEAPQMQPSTNVRFVEPNKRPSATWTILGDECLDRGMTIPSFFHSDYCLPKCFRWNGDDELNIMPHVAYGISEQTKPRIIEVTERWEWLGMDIRGPFPTTTHRHTHILTVTDYYSKWVEAFPLTQNKIHGAAARLAEVILQLGFPLGFLSRLPKHLILVINRSLKKHLNVNTSSLIIHHRQTGYLDLVTESLLNELVCELVEEYPRTWDVHLPAASLRLCCTRHPSTGKKPFTVMYSRNTPTFSRPRELPYSPCDICRSSFIIPHIETSQGNKENAPSAQTCLSDQG